jgi:hypothetical protein
MLHPLKLDFVAAPVCYYFFDTSGEGVCQQENLTLNVELLDRK